MVFLWFSYGIPMVSYGFLMVLLRCSYVFSYMVFHASKVVVGTYLSGSRRNMALFSRTQMFESFKSRALMRRGDEFMEVVVVVMLHRKP